MSIDLTPRLRQAAEYIETHGWTQGTEKDAEGHVCLTGAIRYCAPQTGDEYLIREVLRRRGRAEDWNDDDRRTESDVLAYLRSAEVTDADLAGAFGSQWEHVVTLVRRAAALTAQEVVALAAAWDAAWDAAGAAARDAAGVAAGVAAGAAAWDAAWDAAGAAAGAAARALVVRDLIGRHGFEQHHYDTLTRPWRTVIGKVHPDDQDDLP